MSSESMLSAVPWGRLSRAVQREQVNRENHAPVVSSFRWWARRSHSVMGAILDAARDTFGDDFVVADPFSGGGTVTFEAARRGLTAYAQDLYPWAADGLAAALAPTDVEQFDVAAATLLTALAPHRSKYRTPDGEELTHVLRVRVGRCPGCKCTLHLFPEYLVSRGSRGLKERHAYFGCTSCGGMTRARVDAQRFRCAACDIRHDTTRGTKCCPHCRKQFELADALTLPSHWKAVLVQQLTTTGDRARAQLRVVTPQDPVDVPNAAKAHRILSRDIEDGIETRRLGRMGFTCWGDLYSVRQAEILLDALGQIRQMPYQEAVRNRLAFAVMGCSETPAFLSRWDRFALKPFEGLANHRYAYSTLVVETNPLSSVGRGTLHRRLIAAKKSLTWLSAECNELPQVQQVPATSRKVRPRRGRVVIATGSSTAQPVPNDAVSLVLSDPPYLGDVQYGELARLFHVWLSIYKDSPMPDEAEEAVPNSARGTDCAFFRDTISVCLSESHRTLAADGRLVLTFHNKRLIAWKMLAEALHAAEFDVCSIAVVRAESAVDLCKRNVNSMLHDLVVECRPRRSKRPKLAILVSPKSVAEKNLVAVGAAVAEAVRKGTTAELSELYLSELRRLRTTTKTIS